MRKFNLRVPFISHLLRNKLNSFYQVSCIGFISFLRHINIILHKNFETYTSKKWQPYMWSRNLFFFWLQSVSIIPELRKKCAIIKKIQLMIDWYIVLHMLHTDASNVPISGTKQDIKCWNWGIEWILVTGFENFWTRNLKLLSNMNDMYWL